LQPQWQKLNQQPPPPLLQEQLLQILKLPPN
jgi:hypothetical protein